MTNHHHIELITRFYKAFKDKSAYEMVACYHENVVFEDPAFGVLKGERAKQMWMMLIEKGKDSLEIEFNKITADENSGSAHWTATYLYGKSKRRVVNNVKAQFEFKDGLIIKHKDNFDIWKCASQALGIPGTILGWSGFMKRKIKATTGITLSRFIEKQER